MFMISKFLFCLASLSRNLSQNSPIMDQVVGSIIPLNSFLSASENDKYGIALVLLFPTPFYQQHSFPYAQREADRKRPTSNICYNVPLDWSHLTQL